MSRQASGLRQSYTTKCDTTRKRASHSDSTDGQGGITKVPGHYPPTPADFQGLHGGGPLGGQIDIPSCFMPEDDYSPIWHIGFAHWLEPADRVVKGMLELKQLRDQGKIELHAWPAVLVSANDYDFENPDPPHVVNSPTPMTIDRTMHVVNKQLQFLAAE